MSMNAYPIIASLECEPRQANARLIAAAPELLEALKVAREAIWNGGDTVKAIAAIDRAIARAEGSAS